MYFRVTFELYCTTKVTFKVYGMLYKIVRMIDIDDPRLSCRCDDLEAAVPEEERLRSRPRGQRETLAARPLAQGTADATRVQLLWVHTHTHTLYQWKHQQLFSIYKPLINDFPANQTSCPYIQFK